MTWILAAFTWFRGSLIGRALAMAGGFILIAIMVYSAGARKERKDRELKDAKGYIRITKKASTVAAKARDTAGELTRDELGTSLHKLGRLRKRGL